MDKTIVIALIAALPGLLVGIVSLWVAIKKNPHEIKNTDASTEKSRAEASKIYSEAVENWAEHVVELQEKVRLLENEREVDRNEIRGLRLDIAQVRRENELYHKALLERDAIIEDLKDWIERLRGQLRVHARDVDRVDFCQCKSKGNPV